MTIIAVVPIFTSAGVALLPTIVAAIASLAAIVLKPRELLRLVRRRPLATCMAAGAVALGLAATWSLASGTSPRSSAAGRKRRPITIGHAWPRRSSPRRSVAERPRLPRPSTLRRTPRWCWAATFPAVVTRAGLLRYGLGRCGVTDPRTRCSFPAPRWPGSGSSRPAVRPSWAAIPACWPASTPRPASPSGRSRRRQARTCARSSARPP